MTSIFLPLVLFSHQLRNAKKERRINNAKKKIKKEKKIGRNEKETIACIIHTPSMQVRSQRILLISFNSFTFRCCFAYFTTQFTISFFFFVRIVKLVPHAILGVCISVRACKYYIYNMYI